MPKAVNVIFFTVCGADSSASLVLYLAPCAYAVSVFDAKSSFSLLLLFVTLILLLLMFCTSHCVPVLFRFWRQKQCIFALTVCDVNCTASVVPYLATNTYVCLWRQKQFIFAFLLSVTLILLLLTPCVWHQVSALSLTFNVLSAVLERTVSNPLSLNVYLL